MLWSVLIVFLMIDEGITIPFKLKSEDVGCDVASIGSYTIGSIGLGSLFGRPTTKFMLFTPSNPEEKEMLERTDQSIRDSHFNKDLPIKVLVHGYLVTIKEDDIRLKMKDELLKVGKYNVIVVDWSNGPSYAMAVRRAKDVGADLADLLEIIIKNFDYKAENIHLIGHSLGAHVCGLVGERIPELGRITGLDPAGPCFQDTESAFRLDYNDALFVDVIHTDGGDNLLHGFGIRDPIGHIDFYPNGGKFQPGCAPTSPRRGLFSRAVNVSMELIPNSCDHGRANDLFLESIDNSSCSFLAVPCNSYEDFEKGECSLEEYEPVEMGFHARKMIGMTPKSKYFLKTHEKSPFCTKK